MGWHLGNAQLDQPAPSPPVLAVALSSIDDATLPPLPCTDALVHLTFTKAAMQQIETYCGKAFSMDAYAIVGGCKAYARVVMQTIHSLLRMLQAPLTSGWLHLPCLLSTASNTMGAASLLRP